MNFLKKPVSLVVLVLVMLSFHQKGFAQAEKYSAKGWQLMDYQKDSVFGVSATRAYQELLKGKKSSPVVVAVIDAGVDTAHEDLVGHIWTNKKEIPNNGIDDDHNGYVDDVHGWNFLGGKDGRNITSESLESFREYYRLRPLHGGAADTVSDHYWENVKSTFMKDSIQAAQAVIVVGQLLGQVGITDSILHTAMHKDTLYPDDVRAFQPTDSAAGVAKKNALAYIKRYRLPADMPLEGFMVEAKDYLESNKNKLATINKDPNAVRRDIVGDDFNNIDDRNYGNPNIAAGTPSHGTHVSGIIAASRNNGKGMDGIADNVWIMPIRAVPDGDERDKDVALAIRYAVDNGARVVNMSFGKYFSPGKKWVDDAVKYAEDKDVLLVHAAGNEAKDVDTVMDYPNPDYQVLKRKSSTFVTVGANGGGPDSLVVASFSNYGPTEVDLFAPGVNIYSSVPGSQYASYSGTSMASPTVAGVAALVLEFYPNLSARQLKFVLTHSVMKLPNPKVRLIATGTDVDFASLSVSGGIVNAYNALKLASTLKGEHKKK